ncbi:MAG TPA: mannitol dehydrogenase family protein [Deinococcales bacterium]|nr:mannitol dehydrogenase family protein [Deinococcales bacterium]
MTTPLRQSTLGQLGTLRVPRFDRTTLEPNIVHLGVGGFHRAHQAAYLDDLLETPGTERWSEVGVGILPLDARLHAALAAQDGLYTLVERSASAESARVVGSLLGHVQAPDDLEAALGLVVAERTRLVTLTITEGGYFIDQGSGRFQHDAPEIQRDLADPTAPRTAIGFLVEACARRLAARRPLFTVQSCDNVQHNGNVLRGAMLEFAGMRDPELAGRLADLLVCPNSMVDRITPGTTDADREHVAAAYGVGDAWPVMTEPFRQWVIEDRFALGRPEWEALGPSANILFAPDVAPYESLKMRLLNGSHLALGYLGSLLGFDRVAQAMADPDLRALTAAYMAEVAVVTPEPAGIDQAAYCRQLIERFSNPALPDQIPRLASEGTAKVPKWTFPVAVDLLAAGRPSGLVALVVAAWIVASRRATSDAGTALTYPDERGAWLRDLLSGTGDPALALLSEPTLAPAGLRGHPGFTAQVRGLVAEIEARGTRATIRAALAAAGSQAG